MGLHEAVADWTTDFDHTDDGWVADPFPIWDELRASCPIARTDRYGGGWLPTRFEDIDAIAHDTERFTSRSVVMSQHRPPLEMAPAGVAPPISSDPPFHQGARRVLLPAFAPQAIAKLEASTRSFCEGLVADMSRRAVVNGGVVDGAVDFAQHIPVRVIANMLGFPQEDADRFRAFVHHTLEGVDLPQEERAKGFEDLFGYLDEEVRDHIENPRDDLTSYLLDAEIDGERLTPEHVTRTIGLILIAGIDTTWSAIGASIWHLAGNPDDRKRLAAEPELLPIAMEEFLRAYAPVTMARLVREDMDYQGCPMKAEDWVLLPFPAANRDPEAFDQAGEVVLDRAINRHAAFGLGIHRCAGSHLARMELRVALEVWLDAFGDGFELADPTKVTWSGGQVRGPRTMPIRLLR